MERLEVVCCGSLLAAAPLTTGSPWADYAVLFVWDHFVRGFCHHLPLLLLAVLVLLLLSGAVGRGLGVPLLFWHEAAWPRFFAGFAVAMFFATLFFVGFLLAGYTRYQTTYKAAPTLPPEAPAAPDVEPRKWPDPPYAQSARAEDESPAAAGTGGTPGMPEEGGRYLSHVVLERLVEYAFGMAAIFLALFALLGAWRVVRAFAARPSGATPGPSVAVRALRALWFVGGASAAVLFLLLLVLAADSFLSSGLADFADQTVFGPLRSFTHKYVPKREEAELHVVAALAFLAFLVSYLAYGFDRSGLVVTPVVSVCTLLGGLALVYGFAVFWFVRSPVLREFPWPTLLLLAILLLLLVGGWSRYKFRFAELGYATPVPLADYGKPAPAPAPLRQDTGAARADAPDVRPGPPGRRPVVVVCVSGGASRAAVWVAAVLQELDEKIPGFSHHVRLVTGASGGMLGAACHVAALQKPEGWPAPPPRCRFRPEAPDLLRGLCRDHLTPVVHRLVFNDLHALFFPLSLGSDRGRGLEDAWKIHLGGALDVPFRSLRDGEQEGWRPSLVFSPVLIEDGRRLLISNLDLADVAVNEWNCADGDGPCGTSRSEVEFFKLFPTADKFLLSTAVRMSAAFPFVSPAAVLPTKPRRRVVDAGYFDTYGVELAASWLHERRDWLRRTASRVLLVQIRDGLDEHARNDVAAPVDASSLLSRGLEELLSPLAGVLAARVSVMSFRNDRQLEFLSAALNREFGDGFFTTALFESPADVSMSWYLSEREGKSLCEAVRGETVQARVARLKTWWDAGASAG